MSKKVILCIIVLFFVNLNVFAIGDINIAKDFYDHNLLDKAKETLIQLLHDRDTKNETKAEALYLLGQISYDEANYLTAINDWERLVNEYPETEYSKLAIENIPQIVELRSQIINTEIAKAYIDNGDFWTDANRLNTTIDTYKMPRNELAFRWYDKVIHEFPGSNEAEIAYIHKLLTLINQTKPITVKAFLNHITETVETYNNFETDFPNSSDLQRFQYQIAQMYCSTSGQKDLEKTREWLNKILESSNGVETFYTELAKEKLKSL